jgi:2'-5' RNA ligase
MTRYLIDIRLMGPVHRQVRALADGLAGRFGLAAPAVPHITLAGPFSTGDGERLERDFFRLCSEETRVPRFRVGGYGFFDTSRVVYVAIEPDDALREFRVRLAETLAPYCTLREYDRDPDGDFRFHATLAMKLDWLTYQRIRWHVKDRDAVVHRPQPVRATLLRNAKIVCEYDFARQRMLTPAQARSRATHLMDAEMMKAWADEDGLR